MQPFVNPYLFQNPFYTQCGNNFSQPTQNSCNSVAPAMGINGRYVNDFGEITASDVPMNGQPSLFIKNDRSEVQLREWSPNGQIVSTQFIPYTPQPQEQVNNTTPSIDINAEIITPIFEKISALEDKLDKLAKPVTVRNKKEGEQQ